MDDNKQNINELHMNLMGKIFFAALGAWMVGKAANIKLRGTKDEIDVIARALLSSKQFQNELKKPGATIESVIDKLNVKHMSAKEFESKFGIRWPL